MKKISIVLGVFALVALGSCKSETPQEKAQKESEKALDHAVDANQANQEATKVAVTTDVATVVYTDIAAANAAVAKIPMPALTNDKAKGLASDLGKALVDRINAKDASQVEKSEKKITDLKNDVEKAYQESKIKVEDRDAIKKYIEDCVQAAVGTVAAIHS